MYISTCIGRARNSAVMHGRPYSPLVLLHNICNLGRGLATRDQSLWQVRVLNTIHYVPSHTWILPSQVVMHAADRHVLK